MKLATAHLVFHPAPDRPYRLPPGSPSIIFVFDGQSLGARIECADGCHFEPASSHPRVSMSFWADAPWTDVVQPGAKFTLWSGGDIGRGEVQEVQATAS